MSKLQWDVVGERRYETGVDRCVLFVTNTDGTYGNGVAWSGITAVNESPSGADANALYADNIKYLNLISAEDFGATVEAYTYPAEFEPCDGSTEAAPGVYVTQQNRKMFGLCYRSKVGTDTGGQDFGYKLHFIYGAQAAPSAKNRQTVNESPEAINFSWELKTTPVNVPGHKPTAHLIVDSTKTDSAKMAQLEEIVYGSETSEARLPLPEELISLMTAAA